MVYFSSRVVWLVRGSHPYVRVIGKVAYSSSSGPSKDGFLKRLIQVREFFPTIVESVDNFLNSCRQSEIFPNHV